MTDVRLYSALAALLALQLAAPPTVWAQEGERAAQWCRIDDPAAFRTARIAHRDAGGADDTGVTCPPVASATDLPKTLYVPLPCGRVMAFVKVSTPATNILAHRVAALGASQRASDLRERYERGAWTDTISGAFTENEEGNPAVKDLSDLAARSYYIGKYELTKPQYALHAAGVLDAFSGEEEPDATRVAALCATVDAVVEEAGRGGTPPETGLSWFEAVAAGRAFNAYFHAETMRKIAVDEPSPLPWEQGSPGYLRLPSEAEWEFAARGGVGGLDDASRLTQVYLIRDPVTGALREPGIGEIAIIARGRTKIGGVGRREPNLVGAYDMVGNASEITHDLFRMTRPDMLHGVRGGFVLRGGNALTPKRTLGVTHRREVALVTARGEGSTAYSGVRFVLSAPVFVNGLDPEDRYRTDLRNTEFDAALDTAHKALTSAGATPGASLRTSARASIDAALIGDGENIAERLMEARDALERSEAELNEAARARLEETIRSAAMGVQNIFSNGRLAFMLLMEIENIEVDQIPIVNSTQQAELKAEVAVVRRSWRALEDQIGFQYRHVIGLVLGAAQQDPEVLSGALAAVKVELGSQGLTIYDRVWPALEAALEDFRDKPSQTLRLEYLEKFDLLRDARRETFNIRLE